MELQELRERGSLEQVGVRLIDQPEDGPPDAIPGLLPRSGQLVISGETNVGKAQPLDAKVLTPSGWKRMEELHVGDTLLSPDGLPSEVIAIHPKGIRPVFRVTFADDRSTEVCEDHLWEVTHPNWERSNCVNKSPRVLSTKQIKALSSAELERVHIPVANELYYNNNAELPTDPWLLGFLLGDGSLTHALQFTTADKELAIRVEKALPKGLEVRKLKSKYTYSIVSKKGFKQRSNSLKAALNSLGVWGYKSYDKAIPSQYLDAPPEARRAILAGLLDANGYVSKTNGLSFTSTSKTLAEQVIYLTRSLGGVCNVRSKQAGYKKNGVRKETRIVYTVQIAHPNPKTLVTLTRKQNRLRATRRARALTFKSIVASRITQTQCITVSHPRGLYITDDFIVTHNSLMSLEIASALATGTPLWGSLQPAVKVNKVMYVLGEHYVGVIQRLLAFTKLPMPETAYIVGPEQLGFDKWLVNSGKPNQQAISKFQRWAEGVDLIIWDPLSAFIIGGGEAENDNVAMRLVLDMMSLVSQSCGASCLILAHQGKPSMDRMGNEHTRSRYATRGASGIEDAATNIFYFQQAEAAPLRGGSEKLYDLVLRKYKGPAPERYRLLRSAETLTHTLLGDTKAFQETQKNALLAKIHRIQMANPSFEYRTCLKLVAQFEGLAEETVKRHLGLLS